MIFFSNQGKYTKYLYWCILMNYESDGEFDDGWLTESAPQVNIISAVSEIHVYNLLFEYSNFNCYDTYLNPYNFWVLVLVIKNPYSLWFLVQDGY